jgi:hypothetical protein
VRSTLIPAGVDILPTANYQADRQAGVLFRRGAAGQGGAFLRADRQTDRQAFFSGASGQGRVGRSQGRSRTGHRGKPGIDGAVRNTAHYSVIAGEWPAVKARLETLLDRP